MVANNSNKDIVFPELSYKIMGAAFAAFNELGAGLSEKVYQEALAKELKHLGLAFEREVYVPLQYRRENMVRYFADFIVEKRVIVECKVVKKLGYSHAKQVLGYLRSTGLKLGILLYFTNDGVKCRRVLNSRVHTD